MMKTCKTCAHWVTKLEGRTVGARPGYRKCVSPAVGAARGWRAPTDSCSRWQAPKDARNSDG